MSIFEQTFAHFWNRRLDRRRRPAASGGVDLGRVVRDGRITDQRAALSSEAMVRHAALLGKTGSGKSFLLLYLVRQLIEKNLGFCFFDLHGEVTGQILKMIAQREAVLGQDLSLRTVLIEPADPEFSAGFNVLSSGSGGLQGFVKTAEFTRILRDRWSLNTFGARTEELLRNSLLALSASGQTLLELPLLLTSYSFRAGCLRGEMPPGVREYFQERYDKASDAMRAAMAAPILNKVTAFTQDPHFRHLVGQQDSTLSFARTLDSGSWVLLNLRKGALGEQALTLGSLFLARLKTAIFSRRSRQVFTLFLDEVQNLVAIDDSLDTLFSEARKFAIAVLSANQYLDQYPQAMRASILAINTQIFFRLSGRDASAMAAMYEGGQPLARTLKQLPRRRIVVRSGTGRPVEARVPHLDIPDYDTADLISRCRTRHCRPRPEIEAAIRLRHRQARQNHDEVLDGWD